jgi:heptaprenyl diphosphate synthase
VRELAQTFDVARDEESYLASIKGKTASLMSTACRVGAITAGLSREGIDAVTVFGEKVGMVFQIVDDILDVVSTDDDLGKPAGKDMMEGVYTLPVIRALASESAHDLRKLLGNPLTATEVEEARALVRSDGAVGAAIDVARGYAQLATEALDAEALAPFTRRAEDPVVAAALRALGDDLILTCS